MTLANRLISPIADLKPILDSAKERGYRFLIVGGYVRDALLGRPSSDVDVITDAEPGELETFVRSMGSKPHWVTSKQPKSIVFRFGQIRVDAVSLICKTDATADCSFEDAIRENLNHRDFTVNALAWDPGSNSILDYFDARHDLRDRVIRCVGNADERIREDPVRILRAVRLSGDLNMQIDGTTLKVLKERVGLLHAANAHRVRFELEKSVMSDAVRDELQLASDIGALDVILPEIAALKQMPQGTHCGQDAFSNTIRVVAALPAKRMLRWAGLLHDVGRPDSGMTNCGNNCLPSSKEARRGTAEGIMSRLGFGARSRRAICRLISLRAHLLQYRDTWSDAMTFRLLHECGRQTDDAIRLAIADAAVHEEDDSSEAGIRLRHFRDRCLRLQPAEEVGRYGEPLSGEDLMELLGLGPGPLIGEIKALLRKKIMDGALDPTDKTAAAKIARDIVRRVEN